MAGSVSDDYGIERSSEGFLEFLSGQHCQSSEALAEWRLSEQVDSGTPSTSLPYWDTDEDDDGGPKPSELYGRYTWKIENFSQTSKRELKSEVFDVGGYKWYILIYPQGCDVCNHLSLFLCVANHDKLLPGWSHFAQFTIAVVNKDPKKSKYSDTLHRFWKKEHDWGWKKFMELSKVQDGFIVADILEIRAQVQIIREKAHRPFRCLDRQYRRELVRVYLTNVEQICRRLVEERREKLGKLLNDKVRWLSFYTFWLGVDQNTKDCMSREKTDVIMRVVVKHLFVEKEVTSTLVMDSLNCGLKALEAESKSKQGKSNLLETGETPAPFISVEDDMFVLADDVLTLLERAALEPLPPKDDKGPQNRTKEGNSGEDFKKDSMEQDERRLTELGRKTIETFVLAHIYSKKIEVAYQEAVALKIQEELIREEEAAGKAEIEQKEKRRVAEKEKRSKKKMNKQRRSNCKGKNRGKDEKFDMEVQETPQNSSIKERIESTYSVELAQSMPEKDTFEAVSDLSDIDDDVSETVQLDIEVKHVSSVNWDADSSEALPSMELCGRSSVPLENGNVMTSSSSMDDSSSTCSTDSVPSVIVNGPSKRSSFKNYRTQKSPSREKNQGAMKRHEQINRSRENNTLLHDPRMLSGNRNAVSRISNSDEPELKAVLSSKDDIQKLEQHWIKKDASVSSQLIVKEQVNIDRPSKQMTAAEALSSPTDPTTNITPFVQSKSVPNGNITSVSVREESSTKSPQNDTVVTPMMQLPRTVANSPAEVKKNISSKPVGMPVQYPTINHRPVRSRPPSSAPIVPDPRPTAPMVSTAQTAPVVPMVQSAPMVSMVQSAPMVSMVQAAPMVSVVQTAPMVSVVQTAPSLSWSVSAAGRLNSDSSPAIQSSNPHQSYIGTGPANTLAAHMPGLFPASSLLACPLLYSQSPALVPSLANVTGTDHGLAASGFTFGSVTPEVLHNQPQWTDASQGSSRTAAVGSSILNGTHNFDSYRAGNGGLQSDFTDEFPTSVSFQQAQRASFDEFPHLDIINYLFDEELGNGKETNGSTVSVGPSSAFHQHLGHQFIFPNDMSTLVEVGSTINGHFEQPIAYYDDGAQPVYGAFTNHTNGLTDVALPVDFSIYGNGHFDGMIQNQLPVGYGSNLCLVSDGYPFHMPEYPNLECGVSGYAVYQPSSGH